METTAMSFNYFCWLLVLFLLAFHNKGISQKKGSPNIIFIMADDMGYADLGTYGCKDYTTPHLDQLAAKGMKFTQAYSAAPVCTPARVSYMTGKYPARNPVGLREPLDWSAEDSLLGFKGDQPTIASILKENGYHTALIGKWHLGFGPEYNPGKNGFDDFFGFHGGGVDFIAHSNPAGEHDLFENGIPVETKGYLTNILTDRAIQFLLQEHDQPFFLSLQFNAPHWPWQGPNDIAYHDTMPFRAGGNPAVFAAMIKNLDDNIGRLKESLDRTGLAHNTLIIFISDNGGERYSDMGPLKGRKMSLWEGGIRVPAIVNWPAKIREGSISDQPVITMDWTATMLDAAGVKNLKNYKLDGISLLPFIRNSSKKMDRTFYWRLSRVPQKAIREGKWKYVKDENGEYLFDLINDVGEINNLKDTEKAWFETLKKKYQAWEATVLLAYTYPRK